MPDATPSHLDLQATAKEIMIEHGFEPDFPPQVPRNWPSCGRTRRSSLPPEACPRPSQAPVVFHRQRYFA